MTIIPAVVVFSILLVVFPLAAHGLGTMSTVAISNGSATVCGIIAGKSSQSIQCFQEGTSPIPIPITPNVSFEGISGGKDFFCGLRSGGLQLLCWESSSGNSSFRPKRIYNGPARLTNLNIGEDQVCAIEDQSKMVRCWRGSGENASLPSDQFLTITAGQGFTCGILATNRIVSCWGSDVRKAVEIQNHFSNTSMVTLVAGDSHVCGISVAGNLICRGGNNTGQLLNVPEGFEFSGLALGLSRTCGIRSSNRTVVCWGGGLLSSNIGDNTTFESIVAGGGGDLDLFCGIASLNLSVICWGWNLNSTFLRPRLLPLPKLIPGSCTQNSCSCGIYPDSETLCSASAWFICEPCPPPPPPPPPPLSPPPSASPPSNRTRNRGLLAFAIVGSVGAFSGLCTIIYCIWTGICRQKKIHNSVQPTMAAAATSPPSRSSSYSIFRRQQSSSRAAALKMKRQRSGTSSSKHADRAEEFPLADLAAATGNFSRENKIGAGSFGTVYRGKLFDGREVAIKRGETGPRNKKFQEKENAFQSELAFLSRLHHKHLVSLVGFCEEQEERLLVYEYMHNGALYDHIHNQQSSSPLDSWKMRIKVALDASRGIEYLHNYAVPPIIHRDIKSSNILLDSSWTARVSDFGLSLLSPGSDGEDGDRHLTVNAAGTVGYMDPEYYGLRHLTVKSDVYGFGVVLLELLTGKRAIYKDQEGGPTSVIDYAVPRILGDQIPAVLDPRVGPPELNETEAVELVAYTAVHCLHLEGKERPTMSDIVANLERALALCSNSHSSVSNAAFSITSD